LGLSLKEWFMATSKKSSLAVALKQNRPFVSLQQEAFLSILRTASELSHASDKFLREFDITQPQYNVLRILRGADADGLCRNEISARMVAATPDMSRLLERMEKSGWITREQDENDRRQVSTFITDSGKELLAMIERPFHEQIHRLFNGIRSTDLKMLLDVLAQIRSHRSVLSKKDTYPA
jgi:DNA-binding MarR family transcriptional regulator